MGKLSVECIRRVAVAWARPPKAASPCPRHGRRATLDGRPDGLIAHVHPSGGTADQRGGLTLARGARPSYGSPGSPVAPVSPASATLGSQARRTPPIPPPRISAAVWLPSTER